MMALNLLSPAQKAALRERVLYAMIERLMVACVLVALLSGLLLVLVKSRLAKNLEEVRGRQILTAEYVTVNEDVKALDQQIARVDALQRLAISPSALLLDLAERTPAGIAVTGLDLDLAAAGLRLSGIAARREDLLAYEIAMKGSPYVAQLDSPISNLFQKTDVNFQFAIKLNATALKNARQPAP